MAFNKGLQLVDSNDASNNAVRDSIALGGQSTALFQTQWDGAARQAHGSTVFTIRPDDNETTGGEYQSLLVGQNFAIGLEYNDAGDQYRIVVQSRAAYDTTAPGGPGITTPAFGTFVNTGVETTFGINLNDNGTLTYMHTGSGAQTLSIPGFTPKQASVEITEDAAATQNEIAHIILDDGRGNIVDIQGTAAGANPSSGDLVTDLRANFQNLTTEQKSGFEMAAVSSTDNIVITRQDGAGFTVRAGVDHSATSIDEDGTTAELENNPINASGAPTYLFDLDFDGFVSQVATFDQPLTVSELSGYVNQPNTIPETLVNSDGEDAVAVLTFVTEDTKVFEVVLDDDRGNTITLNHTAAATSSTAAQIIAGMKADHTGLADKQGYALDDSVTGQLTISRADGADFSVHSGTSDYTTGGSGSIVVNGHALESTATGTTTSKEVYTSRDIVSSTMSITEESAGTLVAGTTAGVTYEIVLDAGGTDTLTTSVYVPTGTLTRDTAITALRTKLDGLSDKKDFAFAAISSNAFVISRDDGKNFTAKLGPNDEASNLQVTGGDALTADATVSSTNGVRSGVTDTVSNKVVQNFDFTNLSTAVEVETKAAANYAGGDTLDIFGLNRDDGTSLLKLGETNAYGGVSSSGYTGAVAVSDGAAVASDVLFTQIRAVEDSGVANRQFTVDVFIDPFRITDGDFAAISYNVAWSSDLTIDSLTQQDATGGYKLEDIDVAGDSADARWFKPNAVTDFSAPIATMVFTDTNGATDPTFTFTSVDIDGVDFTDNVTYTTTFTDTLDADLWDLSDTLVNGNDSATAAADQLVIVEGAPGGSSSAPAPTSGLYLKLDSYDQDAGTDAPNVDYNLGVYSSTATNTVSFEIDLPALADTSVDPVTLLSNTAFTLDASLTDWNVTRSVLEGRTLIVEASGVTNLAVGDSVGQIATTITNGFDTTQYFDMVNVQTDADAATENGRGLYVAATRTDSDGDWSVNDMPTGIMTRSYVGTADIGANSVTALDAYYALQMSAGLQPNWWGGTFQEGQALAADFDGSGKITAADALAILEYSVGTIPTPDPVEWVFFDTETSGITSANNVDEIAALATNTAVTASNSALGLGDEVILVGDLSNPAA